MAGWGRVLSGFMLVGIALATFTCETGAGQDGAKWRATEPPAFEPGAAAPQSPARPIAVPPNRCLAVGTLLSNAEGPDPSAVGVPLPGPPGDALSMLEIRIDHQRPAVENTESFCVPAARLTVLAPRADWHAMVGKRVEIELQLLGTTAARWWWLHRLSVVDSD